MLGRLGLSLVLAASCVCLAAAQGVKPPAEVRTPEELGQALEDDEPHIVIRAHLDLSNLNASALTSDGQVFPSFFGGDLTIRVCHSLQSPLPAPTPLESSFALHAAKMPLCSQQCVHSV